MHGHTIHRRSLVALVLVALVLVSAAGAATALSTTAAASENYAASTASTGELHYVYATVPDEHGVVDVTMHVDSAAFEGLRVTLPEDAEARSMDGFDEQAEAGRYEWDETTTDPSITYRWDLGDVHDSFDGGTWGFVRNSGMLMGYTTTRDIERTAAVSGEGRAVKGRALLGDWERHSRTVDGETLLLYHPADVDPSVEPAPALGAMANASRDFQGTPDDGRMATLVMPSVPSSNSLASGTALGERTTAVHTEVGIGTYVHEYVHTRQEYGARADMRWFHEASAEYFEHQSMTRHGYADFAEFEEDLLLQGHDDDSILVDDSTWSTQADYHKGGTVLAAIDRDIRRESGGSGSMAAVLQRLNGHDGLVNRGDFLDAVEAEGGPGARSTAKRYITTEAAPGYDWANEAFDDGFDYDPARIDAELVAADYGDGEGTAGPTTQASTITVPAETEVEFTFRMSNTGGIDGRYAPELEFSQGGGGSDSEVTARPTGWLAPGEETRRTITHKFEWTGEYDLWGVAGPDVEVVEPEPEVTLDEVRAGVGNDTTALDSGDTIELSAGETLTIDGTVTNDGVSRGGYAVAIESADGERAFATHEGELEPGESETITVEHAFEESGTHDVRVGETEFTVDVVERYPETPLGGPPVGIARSVAVLLDGLEGAL